MEGKLDDVIGALQARDVELRWPSKGGART
jgi:hypothetical protein